METETISDQYVDPASAAKWHREKAHDFKIAAYATTAMGIPAAIYTALEARNFYNYSRAHALMAEHQQELTGTAQRLGEQQKAAEFSQFSQKLRADARACSNAAGFGVLLSLALAAVPLFFWRSYFKHRSKANALLEHIVRG
jgi:hypothetical protein